MDATTIDNIEQLQQRLELECASAETALAAIAAALIEISLPLGLDVKSIEAIASPSS